MWRRDLLRVGSLAVASSLLPAGQRAHASPVQKSARSVILLNMMGGVTHIDSFDPKATAPEDVRGTLTAIDTRLPGVQFSEAMPRMAAVADQIALVRSYSHGDNDHFTAQAFTLSGHKVPRAQISTEPNVGSIVAHLQGADDRLPSYIAVPGFTRPGPPPTNLFQGGWLGGKYDPFCAAPTPEVLDFTATDKLDNPPALFDEALGPAELQLPQGMDVERLIDRQKLRQLVDRQFRRADARRVFDQVDAQYRSAFELLGSPQLREAFDVEQETAGIRDTYGRTKIGGRCLLARRLVEAGARFVMVDYGYDPDYGNLWDNHNAPSQNHPHISAMCLRDYHLAGMDRAFAALLADLDQRGLLDETLVVFVTEFGRTPKINDRGGRDHWGLAGSIFFAGGGARRGVVIGATDSQGAYPVTVGYSPADVAATIYQALGIDSRQPLYDFQNRPHFVLAEGKPIPGVLG